MITIDENVITIPRKTWDSVSNNFYFKELIENLIDSEELNEAIENSTELVDLREYDLKRRPNKI
ncbi:MAG: hypothetical protein NTW25_05950 [Candidatus Kapabacteria bacterium]|nr:hypothetical protein [Candidatus Kapabacteria bacterium]